MRADSFGVCVPNSPAHIPPLRFGTFELEVETGELRKSGRAVRLRPQAAKILLLLASRPGNLITREELREKIWGNETFVDFEHGLNLCIREVRAALGDDADTPRYIETLPKRGYRFMVTVEGAQQVAKPSGRRKFAVISAVLLVVVATAIVTNPKHWRERIFGDYAGPVRTIAVLPLQNLSGDEAQDYLADGMTEALTTDLARMESLQVISRTSAMQYKIANKKSLPLIAHELNADAVVEGSVQRSGNRVRVTAQLVRASDDRHLWANTFEREFPDVLALQDDVASAIAKQIETKLGGPKPTPVTKVEKINPQAYDNYLRANSYLDSFDLAKSIDYYNQAIKLDPNYAPAYAHMATAYFFLAFFGEVPPREGFGKMKEAASLAIQKDERLPDGHGALALAKLHFEWDFAGAEQEFKRALELNPNDADVHHGYAHYLMAVGRVAESEAESKKAVELDPVGDGLNSCLCWHSFAARDYDQSVRLAEKFLRAQPNDPWELTILGWTYEQKRMPERAVEQFKKAAEAANGGAFFVAALGHAYALEGNRREADKIIESLTARGKKSYVSPFDLALIYAALGDKDKAFALLDKAVAERSTFLVYTRWEPRLDPLRSDPRFQDLLKRIGLTS